MIKAEEKVSVLGYNYTLRLTIDGIMLSESVSLGNQAYGPKEVPLDVKAMVLDKLVNKFKNMKS